MKIRPGETEIRGAWIQVGNKLVKDDACRRIDHLVSTYLDKIGHDVSGWDTLYRDPASGWYWELVYPQSDLQGGGPPTLRKLSLDEVHVKYGLA